MSFYVWYRCQEPGCRQLFRNRRFKGDVRPRCPHCGSGTTKLFKGDPAKFLPPCSPALKGIFLEDKK
jgi:DNA-directed RNA polymerase subunit RPC12/RpoP